MLLKISFDGNMKFTKDRYEGRILKGIFKLFEFTISRIKTKYWEYLREINLICWSTDATDLF